ncbi:MAG: class I SAM-dependent methyltransferase [Clostridia bacterium]|nr:class I SAM-dependent methyltransferase [Clostridia bacterium]
MYSEFADIYDSLMQDVEYKKWADFFEEIFKRSNIKPELVLDLGCGTGTLTKIMADRGYDMTGVDSSFSMLNKATEKGGNILYLNQDMTEFELYGTMGAIISTLDSINYITDEESLEKVFSLAHNYLDYDGVFVFDINSPYKLKNVLGGNTYTYDENGIFYTWESVYDEDEKLCDFYLTFFVEDEEGKYTRIDEEQTERAWETDELIKMLEKAGFCDIEVFGDKVFSTPTEDEERIFIKAVKREK